MTTPPPAMCPACGASQAPSKEPSRVCNYMCGTMYYFVSGVNEWKRWFGDNIQCRNAFDVAVQLRRENERLRAEISGFLRGELQPEELKD